MIYIGLDDTDNPDSRGTGRLARKIADHTGLPGTVVGITRHQLLQHSSVPCTKKNSAACISLAVDEIEIQQVGEGVSRFMRDHFQPGSDPGLCVAQAVPPQVVDFGGCVKRALVTQQDARQLAAEHGVNLYGLRGDESGVIGALAAVGLAAEGNDGRYIRVGSVRRLQGLLPISDILDAGVTSVKTLDGSPATAGWVEAHKLRPARRDGKPVLFVERNGDYWTPLKLD